MLTFLMPSSTASSSPLTTEMSRDRFCFFLTSRRCHEKSRYRSRLFLAHRRCRERPFAVTKIRSICLLPYLCLSVGSKTSNALFCLSIQADMDPPGDSRPEASGDRRQSEGSGDRPGPEAFGHRQASSTLSGNHSSIFSGFASTALLVFF